MTYNKITLYDLDEFTNLYETAAFDIGRFHKKQFYRLKLFDADVDYKAYYPIKVIVV